MSQDRLAWNEVRVFACAYTAFRKVEGTVENAMCACLSIAPTREEAEQEALIEACATLPESDGWYRHRVAVVNYTVEVQGPIFGLRTTEER